MLQIIEIYCFYQRSIIKSNSQNLSLANIPAGWNRISKKISAITKKLVRLVHGMDQRYQDEVEIVLEISVSYSSAPSLEKKSNFSPESTPSRPSLFVACQICEKYIPNESFENHSKKCIDDYQADENVSNSTK
jgi:hypothetical protein